MPCEQHARHGCCGVRASTDGGGAIPAAAVRRGVASGPRYGAPPLANLSVVVTNTGKVASDHSVLFFAAAPTAGGATGDPLKSLVGFARTGVLAPGESKTVAEPVTPWELSLFDRSGERGPRTGIWRFTAGVGEAAAAAAVTVA